MYYSEIYKYTNKGRVNHPSSKFRAREKWESSDIYTILKYNKRLVRDIHWSFINEKRIGISQSLFSYMIKNYLDKNLSLKKLSLKNLSFIL